MTQKAEPLSSSACLLCQGQCSSEWKKRNCTREMKPKIGERVLKEHLAALNELKSLALDQLYPRDMRELAWIRSYPAVSGLCGTMLTLEMSKCHPNFQNWEEVSATGFHLVLLKSSSG